MKLDRFVLCVLTLAVAACAGQSAAPTGTGPLRWSGSFRQSQMAATSVIGPATPGRGAAYGNITLTPVVETPAGRVRVELTVSAPMPAGTHIAWALFTGPCGAATPPLTGPNEFPVIEISNSGAGAVRTVMPLPLDQRGSYHANVYWDARVSDVSNVMMCANLAQTR
jgi:hypothetical protein